MTHSITHSPLVLRHDHDLLAVIPHRLGFHPHDSLVALALHGENNRLGILARQDLGPVRDGPLIDTCEPLLGAMRRDGATGVVFACYCDAATAFDESGPRLPAGAHRAPLGRMLVPELARALAWLLDSTAIGQVQARCWLVTAGAYWAIEFQADGAIAHWAGPRDRIEQSSCAHELQALMGKPAASRAELLPELRAPEAERRRAMRAASQSWRSRDEAIVSWQLAALKAWRGALGGGPTAAPSAIGRLEAGLRDRAVRDAVMAAMIPGSGDVPERSLVGADGNELTRVFDSVVRAATRPEPALATRARQAAGDVAAHAARRRRAPALAMWAWLEWWDGDPVRTSLLVERALADDPHYSLASLLRQLLDVQVRPGWLALADSG